MNPEKMANCIICDGEFTYNSMFGNRCTSCEATGFEIWGFGESAEYERNKKFTVEQQKEIISIFRKSFWEKKAHGRKAIQPSDELIEIMIRAIKKYMGEGLTKICIVATNEEETKSNFYHTFEDRSHDTAWEFLKDICNREKVNCVTHRL